MYKTVQFILFFQVSQWCILFTDGFFVIFNISKHRNSVIFYVMYIILIYTKISALFIAPCDQLKWEIQIEIHYCFLTSPCNGPKWTLRSDKVWCVKCSYWTDILHLCTFYVHGIIVLFVMFTFTFNVKRNKRNLLLKNFFIKQWPLVFDRQQLLTVFGKR